MSKKRKSHPADSESTKDETLTKKIKNKQMDDATNTKGRKCTVSVALPSSILENAQSPELRTYLAGQVARALVIFNVDEVVIFNESTCNYKNQGVFKGATKASDPNVLFANILQYLECPQYLRKHFFPVHKDLKYAGLLNPLDCPHHMRIDDIVPYREGVTLDRPTKDGEGSYVNVGMRKELKIDKHLTPGVRVTVRMESHDLETVEQKKYLKGKVVSPSAPREQDGLYWGYHVRLANSFKSVFTESPYKDGYDLTIGTSEKGNLVDDLQLTPFNHVLIVFGGVKGLEASLESDEGISETDVELLFDHYINTCPDQGSRTIRTEEAILVTLSALRPKLNKVT